VKLLCFEVEESLVLEKRLRNLFYRFPGKTFKRRDISNVLDLHGGERKELTRLLGKMVSEGVVEAKRGHYRLCYRKTELKGIFSLAERGYGFVRSDNPEQDDLFIPAKYVADAMNADHVLALPLGSDRDGRPYGKIVKILRRAHRHVLGIYQQQRRRAWVQPFDENIAATIFVRLDESVSAQPGQVVKLEFIRYPSQMVAGLGRVVEVLGDPADPQVDIETVIRKHDLPRAFSAEALDQAEKVAEDFSAAEDAQRTDLRELPFMTIDGETAKDFDDAVCLRVGGDGLLRLWVSIADVSHYVAPNTALDLAARERGTSVYFPGYCLPMLPEDLSNGICSLKPDEDRLVMTAEMVFDDCGQRMSAEFYPAIIRSRARLTYTQVADFLAGEPPTELLPDVSEQIPLMHRLAEKFTGLRNKRGSLELAVPDIEIVLDDSGFPMAVTKSQRTDAHRLIEEFMLAANEAAAEFLEKRNYHFLYRIHEAPTLDKLYDFQQLCAECGLGLVLKGNLQKQLQRLLISAADRPEARLVNQQLLRSLQQARYSPLNAGHFGLAAESYCHFTSPIRRYPDLLVHRVLKKALQQPTEKTKVSERLLKLGQECSDKERRAIAAERDLLELRRCQLMQGKVGEEHSGVISSVAEFGFFVELDEFFVEGLVHVRQLAGDYYRFEADSHRLVGERRRKIYRVGMRVQVCVEKVDLWRRRLDFALVE
jgi:ribonuclease R